MADLVAGREAEFLLYQAEDGRTRIEVRFDGETAWLSLGQMAELFQRDKSVISRHIANVVEEGELDRAGTVAKYATVQREGVREVAREIEFDNLDVIISVGYRVKSHRGSNAFAARNHLGASRASEGRGGDGTTTAPNCRRTEAAIPPGAIAASRRVAGCRPRGPPHRR